MNTEISKPEAKPQPPNPPKGFKGKILAIILGSAGLVVILLLIGVGALLAGHVWNPKWSPFKIKDAEKIPPTQILKENILKKIR